MVTWYNNYVSMGDPQKLEKLVSFNGGKSFSNVKRIVVLSDLKRRCTLSPREGAKVLSMFYRTQGLSKFVWTS